ncbi:30S ribosomal protein S16 [Patescibacteria group bacterium]|nr:30S ribosomal protein S16 [Patescibacteria group bacterium]
MLMIRLQRTGRKNNPSFRLALAEKRSKPKSGALELLGSFDPKTKQSILKKERILYWLSQGAHPSTTAHNLLISQGVMRGKKVAVKTARSKVPETKLETVKVENAEKTVEAAVAEVPAV